MSWAILFPLNWARIDIQHNKRPNLLFMQEVATPSPQSKNYFTLASTEQTGTHTGVKFLPRTLLLRIPDPFVSKCKWKEKKMLIITFSVDCRLSFRFLMVKYFSWKTAAFRSVCLCISVDGLSLFPAD